MAVKLISNYAKRLGLPGYSSHQFSVSVETELTDLDQAEGEIARLYGLLQDAVDREIQETGFIPGQDYGEVSTTQPASSHNGNRTNGANGQSSQVWSCSDKQRDLILKLVDENGLDRDHVEQLANDRFGVGVKTLNRLQASGLIAELLETTSKGGGNGNGNGGRKTNGNGNAGFHSRSTVAAGKGGGGR